VRGLPLGAVGRDLLNDSLLPHQRTTAQLARPAPVALEPHLRHRRPLALRLRRTKATPPARPSTIRLAGHRRRRNSKRQQTAAERAAASPVTQPFLPALDVRTAAARANLEAEPTQTLCPVDAGIRDHS
jgi:hypothetical protein